MPSVLPVRLGKKKQRGAAVLFRDTDVALVRDKSFRSRCVLHGVRQRLVQLVDVRQHDRLPIVPRTVIRYVGLDKLSSTSCSLDDGACSGGRRVSGQRLQLGRQSSHVLLCIHP